jgi:hypothetical protein
LSEDGYDNSEPIGVVQTFCLTRTSVELWQTARISIAAAPCGRRYLRFSPNSGARLGDTGGAGDQKGIVEEIIGLLKMRLDFR